MTLRIGLLEVGHWHTQIYVDALNALDVKIIAVSDWQEAVAKKYAEELNCTAYTSYTELLSAEQLDFVFAFGRHCDMAGITKALVTQGVPFAMEKPMALDWQDLKPLVSIAQEKSLFAGVAFPRRHDRIIQQLLALKAGGKMGRVTHFHSRFIGGPPSRYIADGCPWMLRKAESGGGCTINFGTHALDLFCLLVDEPIVRIYGQVTNTVHHTEVEDMSTTILTSESGAVALLESGYVLPGEPKEDYLAITTDKLYYSTDAHRWKNSEICLRAGGTIPVEIVTPSYASYIEDTLQRFRRERPPIADIDDMLQVLQLVNALYQSSEQGVVVEINDM